MFDDPSQIITLLGVVFGAIGGAVMWVSSKVESRIQQKEVQEEKARAELKGLLEAQIQMLNGRLESRDVALSSLLQHVARLEILMAKEGLVVPERPPIV